MRAGRPRMRSAAALSGLLAAAAVLRAAPPSWVSAFPRDTDAYVGIGRGDKRLDPSRYRETAQAEALAQIAREIAVELRSETRRVREEDEGGWRESYRQEVTAASRIDLAGYVLADAYETADAFWVLYTLDKQAFRSLREGRAADFLAWTRRQAEAAEASLAGGRFQEASDRLDSVLVRYRTAYAGDAWQQAHFPEPEARVAALGERIAEAMRGLALSGAADPWVLDWRSGAASAVEMRLEPGIAGRGSGAGTAAAEALTVWISQAGSRGPAACRAETDARGRLDLAEPARRCGLGPGLWRVEWRAPGGRVLALERRVAVRKRDLHVTLQGGDGEPAPRGSAREGALARLREELALIDDLRFRVAAVAPDVRGGRSGPGIPASPGTQALDIRLLEAAADTLEGMHFTALRGRIRFPDGGGTEDIVGESGHADPERSLRKAAADFARQVAAALRARDATAAR